MNWKAIREKYIKARMNEVDEKHLDPKQRAELFNTFVVTALGFPNGLPDPSQNCLYWDTVCYSLENLNRTVQNIGAEEALIAMKVINDLVYTIHYQAAQGLGPGRDEEENTWVDRIEDMKDYRYQQSFEWDTDESENDTLAERGEE